MGAISEEVNSKEEIQEQLDVWFNSSAQRNSLETEIKEKLLQNIADQFYNRIKDQCDGNINNFIKSKIKSKQESLQTIG